MKKAALIGLAALAGAGAAHGEARFPTLSPEAMTPEQKAVAEAIMTGPRKSLGGPFNAWLRSPALADKLQRVGAHLRFETTLPHRLNEFAILIAARHWNAQYEWYAHHPLALQAGLDPAVAADLAEGRRPAAMKPDEAAVYDFCTELRRDKQVSDATFAAAKAALGEQGIVDLIAVSGYYDLVSMTLNVAQVPLPEGTPAPLRPLP